MLAYIRDNSAFLHAEIADRNGVPQTDFCNNFAFDTWLTLVQYPRCEPQAKVRVSIQKDRAQTMRNHAATALQVLIDSRMESLVQCVPQMLALRDANTLDEYINAQCRGPRTALHIAVEHNNTSIIRALVTSGAHVDFHCEHLGTPLDYAMIFERTESVRVLLELGATTRSRLSPYQRRNILNIRGGREPGPDARREEGGSAEGRSRITRID